MKNESIVFVRKVGEEIEDILLDLAHLRIAVFKEFPYLYAGTIAYEKDYLQRYVHTKKAFVFGVYVNGVLVGATTGLPLEDEMEVIQKPFLEANLPLSDFFYFGESILLPEYRGRGWGHVFFDEREAFARSLKSYQKTCFCAVERPLDHPLRPTLYRKNDFFWEKRGYMKQPHLVCEIAWQDLNETAETRKKLTFWTHSLYS